MGGAWFVKVLGGPNVVVGGPNLMVCGLHMKVRGKLVYGGV
jgi:hypothetical protein